MAQKVHINIAVIPVKVILQLHWRRSLTQTIHSGVQDVGQRGGDVTQVTEDAEYFELLSEASLSRSLTESLSMLFCILGWA